MVDSASSADGGQQNEEHHVWVARYGGRRKDHLVVGPSDELADHAPAIGQGETSEVEHLGTFEEFEAKRDSINLDLPEMMPVDGDVTEAIGRERFWTVVRGSAQ